jgi:anti-sigma B factor antagonist
VLEISVDQTSDYTACRPSGELDAYTVGQFREALRELANETRLIIDLSGVPFLDSAGLGALIGGVRRARESGGDVAVCCARPAVSRLLHTTGFDRVAPVTDSEDDAVAALRERAENA